MKVLSLFDGMACGMLAMLRQGINVERYVAYEIDKYAVQTAQHNFPMIEEKGDVFSADFTEYIDFDFLVGGSPCTYWSIAQTKNRETVASGIGWELFSQYVRALNEAKPRYFIYENNKSMSAAIRASITETFGFEPICINSALVSAQNRQRLYWVGIKQPDGSYARADLIQPDDRGILLKHILETTATTWLDKSHTIDATYYKGGTLNSDKLHQNAGRLMAAEPIPGGLEVLNINPSGHGINGAVIHTESKSRTLTTNKGEGQKIIVPVDPVCMRYERSEEAKALRKQYENHKVTHGYHELSELHPRTDGKTNTLSTVLKDNPICEPVCVAQRGRYDDNGVVNQHYEAQPDGKTNTLTTVSKDNLIAEPIKYCTDKNVEHLMRDFGSKGKIVTGDDKTPTLMAAAGMGGGNGIYLADKKENGAPNIYEVKDGLITVKDKQYPIKLADGFYIIRKLTVKECMRLQTVPEWYEWPVSNSQAYKMLGNGWTVEVIAHLISCINPTEKIQEQPKQYEPLPWEV